ncbi:pyridoxamine 5'-phosphate oxidase [Nocardioides albertanoniae]|uniref:Pyridoxamine 5'-phosphate oxidase n=1 Tax=Nocardioides albertanoniae TaxID=1175486 RepID=A0A543ADA0_9ACTN|nr:pyridoxamine 5'-phosphate oxidase family protein [Nocardioides albertanoniae]TQL70486.1 pyridoxamine 5'-phosphate oxidase [Nocardioides albertanoniae]
MAADLDKHVRGIVDSVAYLVLATSDPDGRARTSPVYFSHDGYRDLYWVSASDSQHSRNIVRDSRVAGVIFDSSVPPGSGASAAYVTGMARQVPDFELEKRCQVAFRRLVGTARAFEPQELRGDASLRLYVMDVEVWEAHLPGVDPEDEAAPETRVEADPEI